jgi:hypothetical protein
MEETGYDDRSDKPKCEKSMLGALLPNKDNT